MRLTLEQQAHEARIAATAEALGRALDRGDRKRLKVDLYRLIGERDESVIENMETVRMARAKA